jgi:hypothetical protein
LGREIGHHRHKEEHGEPCLRSIQSVSGSLIARIENGA